MDEAAGATTLVWVRHGEAANNRERAIGGWSDLPLTALGERQAQAVAARLTGSGAAALWSSDVTRAWQTAAPIGLALGLPLVAEPGLRERSLGVLDGLSFEAAAARDPDLFARLRARDPDALPEGGETVAGVFARVAAAIERAVAAYPNQTVILVSHGIALHHAFCHIAGLGTPSAQHRVSTLVDNASCSVVEHRRGRYRLVSWNDTAHLAGLPSPAGPAW